jgi:TolB protein
MSQTIENGHPVWAPDDRIYFHSTRNGDQSIYSVDADGHDPLRVTTGEGSERSIAWARDGSTAEFMASVDGQPFAIYRLQPDGAGEPFVVRPGHDWDPVWSPDGRHIVWMATSEGGDHDLYSIDTAGGEPRRHTDGVGMEASADFDPDGEHLVYLARRDGQNDIYEKKPDGSGRRNLTRNPAEDNGPRISPDGSRIVFFSNRDGDFEIYVMNRDGSSQTRLTRSPGKDVYPSWSPDGASISFESDRSGASQIYRMSSDGTDLRQLTGQ